MIVRIMGEGQFEVDEEVAKGLNQLDEESAQALEAAEMLLPKVLRDDAR